ncbi:hypothetical protein ASF54_03315 [Frondihabitans sp. Leaf304]|nr:hypothetical protein ASF54_03315 [Frondihabitans sp. Leaf304]
MREYATQLSITAKALCSDELVLERHVIRAAHTLFPEQAGETAKKLIDWSKRIGFVVLGFLCVQFMNVLHAAQAKHPNSSGDIIGLLVLLVVAAAFIGVPLFFEFGGMRAKLKVKRN